MRVLSSRCAGTNARFSLPSEQELEGCGLGDAKLLPAEKWRRGGFTPPIRAANITPLGRGKPAAMTVRTQECPRAAGPLTVAEVADISQSRGSLRPSGTSSR